MPVTESLRTVLSPSRENALRNAERLSAVAQLVSSLEYLADDGDRRAGGFNDWNVTRENFVAEPDSLRRLYDALGEERATRALHAARVLAAAVLLTPVSGRSRLVATLVVSGCAKPLHRRHRYGTDGADQLAFVVQLTCALARLGRRDPRVVDSCLAFQAAQATMAYAVSGCAKLASPEWRRGAALPGILRTRTYGDRQAFERCRRHPWLARAATAGVVAMECGFVGAFARRGRYAPAVLAITASFHLVTARLMGLGRFWWAFLATYPAVLYTARRGRPVSGW